MEDKPVIANRHVKLIFRPRRQATDIVADVYARILNDLAVKMVLPGGEQENELNSLFAPPDNGGQPMNEFQRITLYARVSSQNQADKKTMESQRHDLKQLIRQDGRHVDERSP